MFAWQIKAVVLRWKSRLFWVFSPYVCTTLATGVNPQDKGGNQAGMFPRKFLPPLLDVTACCSFSSSLFLFSELAVSLEGPSAPRLSQPCIPAAHRPLELHPVLPTAFHLQPLGFRKPLHLKKQDTEIRGPLRVLPHFAGSCFSCNLPTAVLFEQYGVAPPTGLAWVLSLLQPVLLVTGCFPAFLLRKNLEYSCDLSFEFLPSPSFPSFLQESENLATSTFPSHFIPSPP